jgi:hypothetical protein
MLDCILDELLDELALTLKCIFEYFAYKGLNKLFELNDDSIDQSKTIVFALLRAFPHHDSTKRQDNIHSLVNKGHKLLLIILGKIANQLRIDPKVSSLTQKMLIGKQRLHNILLHLMSPLETFLNKGNILIG